MNVRAAGADVDSVVREGENGLYEIVFHPTRAAPHRVHMKYNEIHISGTIFVSIFFYPFRGSFFVTNHIILF